MQSQYLRVGFSLLLIFVGSSSAWAAQAKPPSAKLATKPTEVTVGAAASAAGREGCAALPNHNKLIASLSDVSKMSHGGMFSPSQLWAVIVDRSGIVCTVAKTGDAWPASRVIAAQKAATANAFSNDKLALATANLYSAVQPGGPLFGLQHGQPIDPAVAYRGAAVAFGTATDPMLGGRIGGINVFGGGLALYNDKNEVVGGLGVSGDNACTDHIAAWRLRKALGFKLPKGVSFTGDDNIVHDFSNGRSAGGFGHPVCNTEAKAIADGLPKEYTDNGE